MQTVYIDHSGMQLEREGEAILLRDRAGSRVTTLPTRAMERLILQGDVVCSTDALAHLLEHGVSVLMLSKRKSSRIASLVGAPHADAAIRVMQYHLYGDPSFRLGIARRILRAKLQGEVRLLQRLLDQGKGARKTLLESRQIIRKGLSGIDEAPSITQGMGIEGASAAAYFSGIFSALPPDVTADVRSRRPPRDPANALLSLGYTLAHHECVSAAYAVGLDPYIGFLHGLDYGRESLACDLVEFLRTLVDTFVLDLLQTRTLRRAHFHMDQQSCLLEKAGRSHFYKAYAVIAPDLRRMARRYAHWISRVVRDAASQKGLAP